MSIKKVQDLRVYKISLELLDKLYGLAYKVPHLKLRIQLTNSGEAIAPLIAEGFAKRRNPKQASYFYEMAMAESDEVGVHLTKAIILSKRFPRIPQDESHNLIEEYISLSKQLNKLSKVWRSFSSKK